MAGAFLAGTSSEESSSDDSNFLAGALAGTALTAALTGAFLAGASSDEESSSDDSAFFA